MAVDQQYADALKEIQKLQRGFRAALKWAAAGVRKDVEAPSFDYSEGGYAPEYLNDLADMRAALHSESTGGMT